MKKKIKIGFDLDGVVAGRPPLVPKRIIEAFFKGCGKGLHYRFPKTRLEQWIRKLSHFYFFRPPLKENIALVKKIARVENGELYLISGRYSFLKKETQIWLKRKGIENLFKRKCFNWGNQQPHLFKERKIKALGLDIYFEDDILVAGYLKRVCKKTNVYLVKKSPSRKIKKLLK